MSWIRSVAVWLRGIFSRRQLDSELAREMRFHLDMEVEKNLRSGMIPDEARRRALIAFGGVQRFREEVSDERGPMSAVVLDARYLMRSLRTSPLFAAITILTIALGIGITTAVVSITDHVLVRGLPFRDSGMLVMLLESDVTGAQRTPSAPTARDWQGDPGVAQAFEGLTFVRGDGMAVTIAGATETLGTAFVEPGFFPLIGVRPLHGRLLSPDDHRADAPRVGVMSYRIWKQRFGADPSVLGRSIPVDSVPTTIVGILPPGAEYPTFAELWIPVSHYRHQEILSRRGLHADSRTIARLRPGIDSTGVDAAMRGISTRLGAEHPREQAGWIPAIQPLRNEVIGDVRPMLLTLTGAAIVVLLLVCANVAGLLLARLTTRTREFAIRNALGASRGRIIAQLVTENFVLAAIGGAAGLGIASLGINLTKGLAAGRIPRAEELAIDARVVAIAAAATVITALLCGLWPALRATHHRTGDALRASTSGSIGIRSEARLRRLLVSAQFALALMLLVGAGLLVQSFRRAAMMDVGFETDGVLTLRIQPSVDAYPDAPSTAALYQRLIDAIRQVPGVVNAGFINHVPLGSAAMVSTLTLAGRAPTDSSRQVLYRTVSDSYLPTMRMSMVAGRWFEDSDIRSPGGRFVINETLARQYWQGPSALGQQITVTRASQSRPDFGQPITGTIVGILADVRHWGQDVAPEPEVYVPYTLETWPWGTLVVRTRDGAASIPAVASAVRLVDARLLPPGRAGEATIGMMNDALASRLEPRRFSMSLLATFALCALILAATGMYGVIAHSIAQRTREIGVRKALGATNPTIMTEILRESLVMIATGVVFGCLGAWAAARLIRGLLFETGVADPLAYAATVAVLAGVALVATYLPARQAMRLEPTIALRAE